MILRRIALLAALFVAACRPSGAARPPRAAPREVDVAAILADSHLPEPLARPLLDDLLGVTIHRLGNGITVYLSPSSDEPRVQGWLAVRAGGRHDPAHATGLAHYLEHMVLFKGSDELGTIDHAAEQPHLERTRALYRELAKAKDETARGRVLAEIDAETQAVARTSIPNELFKLYDRIGFSSTDANTDAEKTCYHTQLPSNRVEQWAVVMSEQLADPVFRLFYPELEAVYEEKNRGLDDPGRRIYEAMMHGLFPEHPYGTQFVLGEPAHLRTPAFDEMVAFFERWYVPNNMAIILSGDVDASVLPVLERHFGRLQPKPLPAPPPGTIVPLASRVEHDVAAPGEPSVLIAWPTVPVGHPDEVALELVDALLDDPRMGLLATGLVRSGKVAWTGAWREHLREGGFLVVEAAVRDDTDHATIEAELRAAVARLGAITPETLQSLKLRAQMMRAFLAERSEPRARRILDAFTRGEPWPEVVAAQARFDALTVADVARVAKRHLGEASVVVRRVRGQADPPKLAKPKITPLVFADAETSPFAARVAAMPVEETPPRFVVAGESFETHALPTGELIAGKNTRNELFSLVLELDHGYRRAPLLCHAVEQWTETGTAELPVATLQQRLFELGAVVRAECDADRVLVSMDGVDRNFDASVELLRAWIAEPVFDGARLREAAATTIAQRRATLDDDDAIVGALRNRAYFGRQSAQLLLPSDRDVERATPKQLRALIAGLFEYRHRVHYFGPRSAESIATAVRFGAGKRAPAPRWARKYARSLRPEIHVVHRPSAKVTMHVVLPADPLPNDADTVASVVAIDLRRQAFDGIRGARALAYSVGAGTDLGRRDDEAVLWAYAQAQPDKLAELVPAALELLTNAKPDEHGLGLARAAVRETARASRVDQRVVPLYVGRWRDRGYDRDPAAVGWARLDAVDVDAATALLGRLRSRAAIITIVGDTSRMDLEGLRAIGSVELHEPAALFSFGGRR